MDVQHDQNLPGAEHCPDDAWTTTVDFKPHERLLQYYFTEALDGSPEQVEKGNFTKIRGKRTEQDIRDFATGRVRRLYNVVKLEISTDYL